MVDRAVFLHYGCGVRAPAGWRNFDASPTLWLQRLPLIGALFRRVRGVPVFPPNVEHGDVVKGLPIAPGSCEAVYASHVLEHLALDDFRVALRNTYTLLKDGGMFRLVVPDLEQLCREYVAATDDQASFRFLEGASLGERVRPRGFMGLLRNWLGNSAHRWMWDYKSLAAELRAAGFTNIRRAQFGDAPVREFAEVEDADRFKDSVGIECIKPPRTPA